MGRAAAGSLLAHGVISASAFFVGLAAAVGAGVVVAGLDSAFFSGIPNFAALFARTSSLRPSELLSILPAFTFGSAGVSFFDVEAGASAFDVGATLVVCRGVEAALGLNGMPNRSARAFLACCSGVKSAAASLVLLSVSGAGAEGA